MPARKIIATRVIGPKLGGSETAITEILGKHGTISRKSTSYEERPEQLDLSALIYSSLRNRRHVLGEAGTGVGKSFAYLVPLIRTIKKRGGRALVAVPTIALQSQIVGKDLPFLASEGILPERFTYALLKGRSNYVCRLKADAFSAEPSFQRPEDITAWPAVSEWMATTTDGDLGKLSTPLPMAIRSEIVSTSDECLGESCPMQATCYSEKAKETARGADVIVTNYAMLMLDLRLRMDTDGIASILPDDIEHIVLDECHQLPDKARSAFSVEMTSGRVEYVFKRIESLAKRATKASRGRAQAKLEDPTAEVEAFVDYESEWAVLVGLARFELRAMFDGFRDRMADAKVTSQNLGDERESMLDALTALYKLQVAMASIPSSLTENDRKSWMKATELLERGINDFVSVASPALDATHVRFATLDQATERVTLTIAPVDVAPILRDYLWSMDVLKAVPGQREPERFPVSIVAVSATISEGTGLGFYREQVGLEDTAEIVVGSPFNYRQNALTYIPDDALSFDSSSARRDPQKWAEYLDLLADRYLTLVMSSGGRAFCLFTSNRVMQSVYTEISGRLKGEGYTVYRQGDYEQTEMIRRFKADGNAVLFGVKTFWEGVDVQGDALSMVIISGMPFTPPDDPIFAARCRLIDRRYGRLASFQRISIPEATIALKQAYGRGVRSKTDRAVVAILDGRLRFKTYGPGVMQSLPPSPITGRLEDVTAFFA